MAIHHDPNANRRRGARYDPLTGWFGGIALVAAMLVIGLVIFGTTDRSSTTTANNAGPASTESNPAPSTTGSGGKIPGPGPSPGPTR